MLCEYLWDEPKNTLLLHMPKPSSGHVLGLLVSADSPDGEHWPLLGVPLSSRWDDPAGIVFVIALPTELFRDKGPVYLTVDPLCDDAFHGECQSERIALVRGNPPRGAGGRYWFVDPYDSYRGIEVHDHYSQSWPDGMAAFSPRQAETLFPAKRIAADHAPVRIEVSVRNDGYEGGHAHAITVRPDSGGNGRLAIRMLPASQACDMLVPPDMLKILRNRSAAPLPDPIRTLSIGRIPREGDEFHIHCGVVEPVRREHALDRAMQFLDRLVFSTDVPTIIDLKLGEQGVTSVPSPLVLIDMGDGRLVQDKGHLRDMVVSVLDSVESGNETTETGAVSEHFVESVRRTVHDRIARALPNAANLRPAHADALLANPSFLQTLAWFDIPMQDRSVQVAIRATYAPLSGEAAMLRQLCRIVVTEQMRPLLSTRPSPLLKARIEDWLTGSHGSAKHAALSCIAVLGWDQSADLIRLGVRPDPLNLVRPDDDLFRELEDAEGRLEILLELGLLPKPSGFLIANASGLGHNVEQLGAHWRDLQGLVAAAQADIGFHPPLGLDQLATQNPSLRPHAILLRALQRSLRAGLVDDLGADRGNALAERLAQRMAERLAADFRMVLAIVQRDAVKLPPFFQNETGFADNGEPLTATFGPSVLADRQALSDWLNQGIEDMELVRSWKADLRSQIGRRGGQGVEGV
jgi:hypothetical protein